MDAALEEAHPDADDERFINRPDAVALFERVFKSSPTEYNVIVGSRGTGKSALAKKVARKMPGVIYIAVADRKKVKLEDNLDSALLAALNWRESVTPWAYVFLNKFITVPAILLQPGKRAPLCVLTIPLTNFFPDSSSEDTGFQRRLKDFELAAARYKSKHGSWPVLVIDNVNAIARDLELLLTLQGMAKLAADDLLYKVVFVSSDGMAPAAMEGESR